MEQTSGFLDAPPAAGTLCYQIIKNQYPRTGDPLVNQYQNTDEMRIILGKLQIFSGFTSILTTHLNFNLRIRK